MCGRGHAWQGGHVWQGAYMAGRACVAGGMHVWGVCVAGGAWWVHAGQRGVHAGDTATEAGGTHPTGMHSCFFDLLPPLSAKLNPQQYI